MVMKDKNFYIKLKNFFRSQGITQQQVGEAIGTHQSYVNSIFTGRNPIGKVVAQKFNDAYGLSVAWLLTGEGPMMAADVSSTGNNTTVSVTAGANGVAVNGNNNTATATNGTPATDIIASLVEANRQLTEQNTKLINYILSTGKPLP